MLAETILHVPIIRMSIYELATYVYICRRYRIHLLKGILCGYKKRKNVLELLNAIHPFGFFFREHKAAERGAELFPTGSMRHAP